MPSKRHLRKISILCACFKSLKIWEINALFARSIWLNCVQSGFTPVLQNFWKPWKSFHYLVDFLPSIILIIWLFTLSVLHNKYIFLMLCYSVGYCFNAQYYPTYQAFFLLYLDSRLLKFCILMRFISWMEMIVWTACKTSAHCLA